ncbi:hypothetical protein J6590_019855 [Homalodisca vitripennis]|nr:hypothetical protein J6590_019855 [Homalodisca vitripennis]
MYPVESLADDGQFGALQETSDQLVLGSNTAAIAISVTDIEMISIDSPKSWNDGLPD